VISRPLSPLLVPDKGFSQPCPDLLIGPAWQMDRSPQGRFLLERQIQPTIGVLARPTLAGLYRDYFI
jgi:hypothetical protein